MMKRFALAVSAVALTTVLFAGQTAFAGPYIIDGTDADDHGFASGGANQDGWFYIQRGLESIASSSALTKTGKSIVALGSDSGTQAANAVQSAVALSPTLSAAGWTVTLVNGAAAINAFFANPGSASVIYMDSTQLNVTGGLDPSEQAAIDANATNINAFLGAGGGLFSHSQTYGWLNALVPGLVPTNFQGSSGISLTAAGSAAFPGLTDQDLSAGPYHNTFANTQQVPVLGVGSPNTSLAGQAVILGSQGGSITNPTGPTAVPGPVAGAGLVPMMGLLGLWFARRRGRTAGMLRDRSS